MSVDIESQQPEKNKSDIETSTNIETDTDNPICSICLDPIRIEKLYITPCKHKFHVKCFAKYINTKNNKQMIPCPNCMIEFKNIFNIQIPDNHNPQYSTNEQIMTHTIPISHIQIPTSPIPISNPLTIQSINIIPTFQNSDNNCRCERKQICITLCLISVIICICLIIQGI